MKTSYPLPNVGDDANEWNPEHFLDLSKVQASNVGVFGNV